jgi:hypothetical protein
LNSNSSEKKHSRGLSGFFKSSNHDQAAESENDSKKNGKKEEKSDKKNKSEKNGKEKKTENKTKDAKKSKKKQEEEPTFFSKALSTITGNE